MSRASNLSQFDQSDRNCFSIKDARTRADTLKDNVVPKLKHLFRETIPGLEDCFGPEWMNDFKDSFIPHHRPDALTTRLFADARYGLVKKQLKGKFYYIWLVFCLNKKRVSVSLITERGLDETSPLFDLLNQHRAAVVPYLEKFGLYINHRMNTKDLKDRDAVIKYAQINTQAKWHQGRLFHSGFDYPFQEPRMNDDLSTRFLLLFPFLQATCNIFLGKPDHLVPLLDKAREYVH